LEYQWDPEHIGDFQRKLECELEPDPYSDSVPDADVELVGVEQPVAEPYSDSECHRDVKHER